MKEDKNELNGEQLEIMDLNNVKEEKTEKEDKTKEKVDKILKKAKEKGKITYGELADRKSVV